MPMPHGTKKWTTLAQMPSDTEVFEYFKSQRGFDERHAKNSVCLLRRNFDAQGNKRPIPLPSYTFSGDAPSVPRAMPSAQDYDLARVSGGNAFRDGLPRDVPDYFAPMQAAWLTGYDDAREAARAEKATPEPESVPPELPPNDPLGPLAQALAPHLLKSVLKSVTRYIDDARAKMEQEAALLRTKIIVIDAKQEKRELEGLHHEKAAEVIALVVGGLDLMLVGPAGCGKTVIASSVQQALKAKRLVCISCSAGASESKFSGRLLPMGAGGAFVYLPAAFLEAYENGGVILLDEIDAADPNLLLFLNSALGNKFLEVDERAANGLPTLVKRHADTVILAAANTWGNGATTEYIGRGALDASTLDRFLRIPVDYDHGLEAQLAPQEIVSWVQNVRHHARNAKLKRVVSTRMITRVAKVMAAGFTLEQAKAMELSSWSVDERSKVYVS